MKSKAWDESVLADHRAWIRKDSARNAFDVMVAAAIALPSYEAEPGWHGEIREFRYNDAASRERPFAFIVNRNDLLFYVRSPGLDRVRGGFAGLKDAFPTAAENSRGEWTLRVASEQDADRLYRLVLVGQAATRDRTDDTQVARSVISTVLSNDVIRKAVLQQLVISSEAAERTAPSAWGATLFRHGFRLNVGQVETIVCHSDLLRLNLVGQVGRAPFKGRLFSACRYHSVPDTSCAFSGTGKDFVNYRLKLQDAHLRFVYRAATTQSGKPRQGTAFRNSHSTGLMAYAYAETGRGGDTLQSFPDELDPALRFIEGARKQAWVNAFERDPRARQACLTHYGFHCAVCDFDFADRYGAIGKEFIHVHHLKPMALTDGEYELDPLADLRPVCPNCHAMLHRGENLLSIDELRGLLKRG